MHLVSIEKVLFSYQKISYTEKLVRLKFDKSDNKSV